jgi:integrase
VNLQVKEGETTTSARAITPVSISMSTVVWIYLTLFLKDIMEKLYDFNHLPEYWGRRDDQSNMDKRSIHNWGGPLARRVAQAIYTVMFVCLLRVDEVLKIKTEHIVFEDKKVTLTLPFRKTHQFGGKIHVLSFRFTTVYTFG